MILDAAEGPVTITPGSRLKTARRLVKRGLLTWVIEDHAAAITDASRTLLSSRQRRTTAREVAQIRSLFEANFARSDIARLTGVPGTTVDAWIKNLKLTRDQRFIQPVRKRSSDRATAVFMYIYMMLSGVEIAQRLGKPPGTVYWWLKDAGVQSRDRAEANRLYRDRHWDDEKSDRRAQMNSARLHANGGPPPLNDIQRQRGKDMYLNEATYVEIVQELGGTAAQYTAYFRRKGVLRSRREADRLSSERKKGQPPVFLVAS